MMQNIELQLPNTGQTFARDVPRSANGKERYQRGFSMGYMLKNLMPGVTV
jgi:hypothetical protein